MQKPFIYLRNVKRMISYKFWLVVSRLYWCGVRGFAPRPRHQHRDTVFTEAIPNFDLYFCLLLVFGKLHMTDLVSFYVFHIYVHRRPRKLPNLSRPCSTPNDSEHELFQVILAVMNEKSFDRMLALLAHVLVPRASTRASKQW